MTIINIYYYSLASRYLQIHNNEVDYSQRTDSIACIVTGTEHHSFKLRLVTEKYISFDDCFDRHEGCASYKITNKNAIVFTELELQHSVRYESTCAPNVAAMVRILFENIAVHSVCTYWTLKTISISYHLYVVWDVKESLSLK